MSFMRYWKEPVPTFLGASLRTGSLWIAEVTLLYGTCLSLLSIISFDKYNNGPHEADRFLFLIPLVLGSITAIVGGLLFYGVIKQKPALLLPWIICASITTCLVLLTVLGLGFWMALEYSVSGPIWINVITYGIVVCAVMRYCIVGVHSFYRLLKVAESSTQIEILT